MTRTTLAVAADYADALMTARRAKNWLFMLLLVMLLAQIGLFLTARFNVLKLTEPASMSDLATANSALTPTTSASVPLMFEKETKAGQIVQYVIPVTEFLGIILIIVLGIVLLLLTGIMVVGRLIGVSHLTSAFIWAVVLAAFLFPWQAFLISHVGPGGETTLAAQPAFKVPGVLYTYTELQQDCHFAMDKDNWRQGLLKGARFIGFPVIAVIILLVVQARSSRGLKMALGETEIQVDLDRSHEGM
jgi:hypothetical protein